jgi:hypothetical protein
MGPLNFEFVIFDAHWIDMGEQADRGMEQRTLRNVNNYLNVNIYSYFEISGGKSSNLYLNVHFFNTRVD